MSFTFHIASNGTNRREQWDYISLSVDGVVLGLVELKENDGVL